MSRRYWVVRAKFLEGAYTDDEDNEDDWKICRDNNFVAIGWSKIGDLTKFSYNNVELLKQKLKENWSNTNKYRLSNWTGQILRFVNEIEKGDVVILPTYPQEGLIIYYIGEVLSDAYYVENPSDEAYSKTRRDVKWLAKISRDDISEKLRRSLFGQMTVFNIDKHKAEIEKIIETNQIIEEQPVRSENEETLNDEKIGKIIDKLMNIDPYEFEELVVELLNLDRDFTTVKTKNISDGGVDFVCVDDRGDVRYKGQVKSVSRPIGISDILKLRGTLNPNQEGIFVTTSHFTPSAIEEAQAPGKAELELIGRKKLSELVLKYYDSLSKKFKEKIDLVN